VKRVVAVCAGAVLVALTGCGSTSGSGPGDPASVRPASSLAYAGSGAQSRTYRDTGYKVQPDRTAGLR
jgi:hypothetical protein